MSRKNVAATVFAAFVMIAAASPSQAAVTCADQMKTVKTQWDTAQAGVVRDEALIHYNAAEKAHTAKDEKTCISELNLASDMIAQANQSRSR